jgi:hypothetical protein
MGLVASHSGAPARGAARGRAFRIAAATIGGGAMLFGLAACVGAPAPAPTTHAATSSSTPGPIPSVVPTLDPNGSAAQNLLFFNQVNQQTLAAKPSATGMDFINGLVAAGFNKSDMQVTSDKTSINLQPGSVQFSVKMKDQCLIGQFGPDSGGYQSMVAAPISTGTCLIGNTVPIP